MHFSLFVYKYIYTIIYTCLACLWDGYNNSSWVGDKNVWYILPLLEDSDSPEVVGGTFSNFFQAL